MTRICFDVDLTICRGRKPGQSYEDCSPIEGAVEMLQRLKSEGYEIIIYTARNMRTYQNNIGKIAANQIKVLTVWLEKWKIPYDEIWLKPDAEIFIDDKAFKFMNNWADVYTAIKQLKDTF